MAKKSRMLYGKLLLLKPNVLVMDEPTNHMDMESIESLNMALEKIQRHVDFRIARPSVCIFIGYPNHRIGWQRRI